MNHPPSTIESALTGAANVLAGISDSPRVDAEALLAWALDASRSYLLAHPEKALSEQAGRDFENAIARRRTGEPLAYITGKKEFWSLELKVTPDVLVPRPETELLVEKALELIPEGESCRILDLGTGSGAIAIAIASERERCEIYAVDESPGALEVARENAALHGLRNVVFLQGNWTEPVRDLKFDLAVSNPPYVRNGDPALNDLRYEPRRALDGGPDGLDAIRRIAGDAKPVMKENGYLLLEHGADQDGPVATALGREGWVGIGCFRDLAGHPRVTRARMETPSTQDQP
jgi:release factor glutamine methyltransferase